MTLKDIYKKYPTQEDCIKHLEKIRWNNVPACPYCNSTNQTKIKNTNRYQCNNCNTSYSVTVGTIFHKTKLDLQKWFYALSLVLDINQNYSSRELGKEIEVTKDTAWRILQQIRKGYIEQRELIEGIIKTRK